MNISLQQAADRLNQGKLVAIPTETVYGLAARIDRPEAISAIFQTKGRPRQNPLIVHVESIESLDFVDLTLPDTTRLIEAFWPGPLTLILPLKRPLDPQITAGLSTVAVRSPSHPLCLELLAKTGPLVAPSANPSGRPSPSCAEHIREDYQGKLPWLDGGPCQAGVESTILAFDGATWRLARRGALSTSAIKTVLGYEPALMEVGEKAICPGQRWRHYAPKAKLLALAAKPQSYEAVVGFSERSYAAPNYVIGSLNDPRSCLKGLYGALRSLDRDEVSLAAIDLNFPLGMSQSPDDDLWLTLRERLEKAIGAAELIEDAT